ncbi:hypothetical protein [Pedobacter sp.]|jgi:hypothetical protein|uniref:hypothetical protein n=1 Tax=Pedobacter sp. TaxID=1411316 RepID=UPI002C56188C|nr:hypothetical protein [Pedobacter sp.]HWW37837.1 hypothetical protein [Pedobacter sp.]
MIDLTALSGTSIEGILNIVIQNDSERYEVYVPKSTQQYFSDRIAIADDYAKAAYSGHLLSLISESFIYEEAVPAAHESILFEIETKDTSGLAQILFDLTFIYGINSDSEIEDADVDNYDEDLWQYIDDVQTKKIIPVCPYFIEIVTEFSEEEETE